ncbi:MAG: J domain-containing protein [Granulosicoccus sp.]
MTPKDAAAILSIAGKITKEAVKDAYRRAASKFHPDKNPAGTEMMKLVNAAYDTLRDFTGTIDVDSISESDQRYPDDVNNALNAIVELSGLVIEICGAWVWVAGDTYRHKEALKAAEFRFSGKKKRWYFRPEDWSSTSRGAYSMDDIREKFGSECVAGKPKKKLQVSV